MAIKCGNCHKSHDTVQEVAQCHGEVQGAAVVLATEKQVSYLRVLVGERYEADANPLPHPEKLSKADASAMIEQLLKQPRLAKTASRSNGWKDDTVIKGTVPKDGTYTVQMTAGHRTFRIRKPHPQADWKAVEYLFGADNESSFTKMGRVVESGVAVWGKYDTNTELITALKFLLNLDDAQLKAAGYEYALASGNCYRCGRKLTVPASIHAGMGPICAGKEEM